MKHTHTIPVHILSGFLGSGKTTLLTRALDYYQLNGRKPAVLMNELGEVNLDGMQVSAEVPMTEMLGGCICCTIRGDLGLELKQLIDEHQPDVVFVESTGAANPMEMLDGVTDASLLTRVELASVVTVVDAALFAEKSESPKSRTYRLMADQIRCATLILFNKTDLVPPSEWLRLEALIRELNPSAPIVRTVRSEIDFTLFDRLEGGVVRHHRDNALGCTCAEGHSHHEHPDDHGCAVHHAEHSGHSEDAAKAAHHSHDHVMAYTHFFHPGHRQRAVRSVGWKAAGQHFSSQGYFAVYRYGKSVYVPVCVPANGFYENCAEGKRAERRRLYRGALRPVRPGNRVDGA